MNSEEGVKAFTKSVLHVVQTCLAEFVTVIVAHFQDQPLQ